METKAHQNTWTLEPWLYHDLRICPVFTRSCHLRLLDFQAWSHSLEGMYETNVWVTSTRRLSFSPELSVPYIVHLHIKFRNSSLNIPEGCILLCLIFLTCLKLKLKSYGQNYTSTLYPIWTPQKYCLIKASAWRKKRDFLLKTTTSWWFRIFFVFIPIWGRFPIWLIFFKWVETTN